MICAALQIHERIDRILRGHSFTAAEINADCSMKGTNDAWSGKSLARLSRVDANTSSRPAPTFLFDQQRRSVRQLGHDTILAGFDPRDLIELHVIEFANTGNGGMGLVHITGSVEAFIVA